VGFRQIAAVSAAASLIFSSAGAVAATASAPMPMPQQANPWAALSVLSARAPAAALCGSAAMTAATTQPATGCVLPAVDVAPPGPVGEAPGPMPIAGIGAPSLWIALGAIAGMAGVYSLLKGQKSRPVSPG